jgi:hypothetical protein
LNDKRKEIEMKIYQESNMSLINTYDFKSFNPIVVYGDNWHKGVIGIVASRLVDNYSKPVVILSKTEDGLYHGSCRTYGTISIIDMLDSAKDYILQYGGHEGAAGLTVEPDKLDDFIKALNAYADKNFDESMFVPKLDADMTVSLNEITLDNFDYIKTFAPYGNGNSDPVFVVRNVRINAMRKIGQKEGFENAHLKMSVSDMLKKNTVEGIGFFNSKFADILNIGDSVDIMFKPSINEWQGQRTPQMQILDIQSEVYQKEGVSTEEDIMYLEDGIGIAEMAEEYGLSIDEYIPNKDECFYTYKALSSLIAKQSNRILITDLDILSLIVNRMLKRYYISPFKLARIIEINTEAGYFYSKRMLFGKMFIALTDGQHIVKISETETYKNLEEEKKIIND